MMAAVVGKACPRIANDRKCGEDEIKAVERNGSAAFFQLQTIIGFYLTFYFICVSIKKIIHTKPI